MSSVIVKVRGLADCQANIQQALKNIEIGTEAALDVVAEATLADDIANCPVGTPESTGIPGYKGGTLRDGQQIYAARLLRQIGSDVPYHWYVNDGTYKMAARPFTTNAFEANKGQLVPECQKIKVV